MIRKAKESTTTETMKVSIFSISQFLKEIKDHYKIKPPH